MFLRLLLHGTCTILPTVREISLVKIFDLRINKIGNVIKVHSVTRQGRIQGAPGAPPHPPPKIGKNMIFWRKIVIFHMKYSKKVRAPNLKSWIRPCPWPTLVFCFLFYCSPAWRTENCIVNDTFSLNDLSFSLIKKIGGNYYIDKFELEMFI